MPEVPCCSPHCWYIRANMKFHENMANPPVLLISLLFWRIIFPTCDLLSSTPHKNYYNSSNISLVATEFRLCKASTIRSRSEPSSHRIRDQGQAAEMSFPHRWSTGTYHISVCMKHPIVPLGFHITTMGTQTESSVCVVFAISWILKSDKETAVLSEPN